MATNFVEGDAMLLTAEELVWSRGAKQVSAMQAMALLVVGHLPSIFFNRLYKRFRQFDFFKFALDHPA